MEGEDMELVSIESDGAQYKSKPQEIERALNTTKGVYQ